MYYNKANITAFLRIFCSYAGDGATVPIPTLLWMCSSCVSDSTRNFPKSRLETILQPVTGFSCSKRNSPSASSETRATDMNYIKRKRERGYDRHSQQVVNQSDNNAYLRYEEGGGLSTRDHQPM